MPRLYYLQIIKLCIICKIADNDVIFAAVWFQILMNALQMRTAVHQGPAQTQWEVSTVFARVVQKDMEDRSMAVALVSKTRHCTECRPEQECRPLTECRPEQECSKFLPHS